MARLVQRAESVGEHPLRFPGQMLDAFQVQRAAIGQAQLVEDVRAPAGRADDGGESGASERQLTQMMARDARPD